MENTWQNRAIALLDNCFSSIATELNEMDWKVSLSDNKERLAQHICAFANYPNGGFLVFGIANDGAMYNVNMSDADEIVNKIGNLARNKFNYSIIVEHATITYLGYNLVIIYIRENVNKPVSIRKEGIMGAYTRSARQTVKLSEEEIRNILGNSSGVSFENKISRGGLSETEILLELAHTEFFRLLGKATPSPRYILETFIAEGFIHKDHYTGQYKITNLGAIMLSKSWADEGLLKTKRIRVIQYKGTNKLDSIKDQTGNLGYVFALPRLVDYIIDALPQNEIIAKAIRQDFPLYPKVAIREFIANALIHQDFTISGSNVTIEIFSDRMEIINPGVPLVDIDRIIDSPPRARNYSLSEIMRRLGMCEKRGSGIQRSLLEIETYQLPAPKFIKGENYTKVILYAPIRYQDMSDEDRTRACFQHCVLSYISGRKANNESVRERFKISKNNYTMATKILKETLNAKWIKIDDPNSDSLKHRSYVPFWA